MLLYSRNLFFHNNKYTFLCAISCLQHSPTISRESVDDARPRDSESRTPQETDAAKKLPEQHQYLLWFSKSCLASCSGSHTFEGNGNAADLPGIDTTHCSYLRFASSEGNLHVDKCR